jgi:hypothetical protein
MLISSHYKDSLLKLVVFLFLSTMKCYQHCRCLSIILYYNIQRQQKGFWFVWLLTCSRDEIWENMESIEQLAETSLQRDSLRLRCLVQDNIAHANISWSMPSSPHRRSTPACFVHITGRIFGVPQKTNTPHGQKKWRFARAHLSTSIYRPKICGNAAIVPLIT